jgi:hypothetical protein
MKNPPFIAVNATPAMSGHFATLYAWSEDEELGGFYEPYETGFGRYATWQEAEVEAARWAEEMEIEHHPLTQADVDEAERRLAELRARVANMKETRE